MECREKQARKKQHASYGHAAFSWPGPTAQLECGSHIAFWSNVFNCFYNSFFNGRFPPQRDLFEEEYRDQTGDHETSTQNEDIVNTLREANFNRVNGNVEDHKT